MAQMSDEIDGIDLAVVAYLDDGTWVVQELAPAALENLEAIGRELRRYPGETGALALISVDEDFVLLVRAQGTNIKVLLSDATAATEWELARGVVDHLGVPVEDDEEQVPAGDLAIVADMGLSAAAMGELMDDYDLYPDEVLSEIAARLGFGDRFDALAGIGG